MPLSWLRKISDRIWCQKQSQKRARLEIQPTGSWDARSNFEGEDVHRFQSLHFQLLTIWGLETLKGEEVMD